MRTIYIDGRPIGPEHPPYVIAELSANHNGNIDRALQLIDSAADAGADAVKLQTYRADTITLDSTSPEFQITSGPWAGRTLYELYDWAHTPWEWHPILFQRARERGITIFSSPFDRTAVDFLAELGTPAFKVASFELTDLPLIRYIAAKAKPMIISTGMGNRDEVRDALEAAREGGCRNLVLLHAVSGYPAPPSDYNLATLNDLARTFGHPVGLSDHTLGNITAIASVALGASVIEKHVTLNRNGGGPDDAFSLEPSELANLICGARTAWEAIGKVDYGHKSSEAGNVKFRRSLYFVRPIEAGNVVTVDDVRSIRPGYGLAPKFLPQILGRRLIRSVSAASPVTWDLFE